MILQYLLDEHVPPALRTEIVRREPSVLVSMVGDPGAPRRGTLDPEILIWCEENAFLLVTNNRRSMPGHLAAHLAQGRHVPGIFVLNPNLSIPITAEELNLIAIASFDGEHDDTIKYLPLS